MVSRIQRTVAEVVHGGAPLDADQITDVAVTTVVAAFIGLSNVTFTIKYALIAPLHGFASRDVRRVMMEFLILLILRIRRLIRLIRVLGTMIIPGLLNMLIIGTILMRQRTGL